MTNISNTSLPLKLIMAFAIFWMVIGELITYHQKVIYGTDLFDNHFPFTKPKQSDDGGMTHLKPVKNIDKSDDDHFDALLVPQQQRFLSLCSFYTELKFRLGKSILQTELLFFSGLRAPPTASNP